jgi:hypothetical protein
MIYKNSQVGLGTKSNIHLFQPKNITISNNNLQGTNYETYAISEAGTTDYTLITHNRIYGTYSHGKLYLLGSHTVTLFNEGYMTTIPTVNMTNPELGFMWFDNSTKDLTLFDGATWLKTTLS